MSSKPKNAFSDWEMLRSMMREIKLMEEDCDVDVATHIGVCGGSARLSVSLEAFDTHTDAAQAPLCRYRAEWPNANVISFTALLFNAAVQLRRLVDDSRRDAWSDSLRAQGRG